MISIGVPAAILTTGAFVPQVIKTVRTKDTHALSLVMLWMQIIGICLWLLHGVMIRDAALYTANSVTLLLNLILLRYKLRYK